VQTTCRMLPSPLPPSHKFTHTHTHMRTEPNFASMGENGDVWEGPKKTTSMCKCAPPWGRNLAYRWFWGPPNNHRFRLYLAKFRFVMGRHKATHEQNCRSHTTLPHSPVPSSMWVATASTVPYTPLPRERHSRQHSQLPNKAARRTMQGPHLPALSPCPPPPPPQASLWLLLLNFCSGRWKQSCTT
jgi:hypothetical protein